MPDESTVRKLTRRIGVDTVNEITRGAGARPWRDAKLKAADRLQELADCCEKVAAQIRQRVAREPITDRLVSCPIPTPADPKGKLGKPNEFGYVSQICPSRPEPRNRRQAHL